jgi:peroxiredoxin
MRSLFLTIFAAIVLAFLFQNYQSTQNRQTYDQQLGYNQNYHEPEPKPVKVGEFPPDFEGQLISDEHFKLQEYLGKKMLVLSFFAGWCSPCQAEVPNLNRFIKQHEDEVYLLGIASLESLDQVKAVAKNFNINYPVLVETDKLKHIFNIQGYPASVIIGLDGKIQFIGPSEVDPTQALEKYLVKNKTQNQDQNNAQLVIQSFQKYQLVNQFKTIQIVPYKAEPVPNFEANGKDEIHALQVVDESSKSINLEVEYTYSGILGDKEVYIDCDPYLEDGRAPFAMRPIALRIGNHKGTTILSSYSGTPAGAESVKIKCLMNSRINHKELASKAIDFKKIWDR